MQESTTTLLSSAALSSRKSDAEIAEQAGLRKSNLFTMMRQGLIKVPIHHVPALAHVLDIDDQVFLASVLTDHWPTVRNDLVVRLGEREGAVIYGLLLRLPGKNAS